jgi:hypothetical protein
MLCYRHLQVLTMTLIFKNNLNSGSRITLLGLGGLLIITFTNSNH